VIFFGADLIVEIHFKMVYLWKVLYWWTVVIMLCVLCTRIHFVSLVGQPIFWP